MDAGETHLQALLSLKVEAEHLERKDGIAIVAVIIRVVYALQKTDADSGLFWKARRQLLALLELFSCMQFLQVCGQLY
jgi:hypothetical protein